MPPMSPIFTVTISSSPCYFAAIVISLLPHFWSPLIRYFISSSRRHAIAGCYHTGAAFAGSASFSHADMPRFAAWRAACYVAARRICASCCAYDIRHCRYALYTLFRYGGARAQRGGAARSAAAFARAAFLLLLMSECYWPRPTAYRPMWMPTPQQWCLGEKESHDG